jgi:hypothetical protein
VRPKTIVYFEWINFGMILLGVLQSYFIWDRIYALGNPPDRNLQAAIFGIFLIFMFVLAATLTLLVSRRRSKIAMWILIVLFAFGLYGIVESIIRGQFGSALKMTALEQIVQGVGLGLLFTPSARRWMNREDEKNERLREVFH